MNYSCTARDCPHVQYIRNLLETTETCRAEEVSPECGWSRYLPYLKKSARYIVAGLEIVICFWFLMTKAALQIWLRVLDSKSYYWLGFLVCASALISSLPGVRGSMSLEDGLSAVHGTMTKHCSCMALIAIR
ncbi:uncharacterized protein LOC131689345 [Topomyia yanbarensis]|uniref:uncharacterized protein LOC131689345 n=1 Tax=Topomyia yanbarensis TaxID=2498891 RepID=UPI00273CD90B|nr:uncharacterized protein LOC131689345 [Topomyia yanbarensis]